MTRLRIGKHSWKVEISDYHDEAEPDDLGVCVWDDKVIWVNSKQSEKQITITLVHEILHAIAYSHKLTLRHPTIEMLQGPIADLIRKNF